MLFSAVLSVAALVASAAAQGPVIQTPPGLTQCQNAQLIFSGGTPPYIITAIPGGQVGAAPLATIASNVTDSPLTWKVNIEAGTSVTLQINDNTGAPNYALALTVLPSSDNTCLGVTPSGSSSAAVSATDSAPAATSTPASSAAVTSPSASAPASSPSASASASVSASGSASKTTPASSAANSASKTGSSSASAAASSPVKSGAAYMTGVNWSFASLMGLVGAAALF